jgi:hypothetical protein
MEIKEGTINVTIPFKLRNSSNGTAKTGLVFDSAGVKCYYVRGRGLPVQIALVTLAAADSAHSDGGFKEKSAANMKGSYRLDLPDAVCAAGLAAGVKFVTVHIEFTDVFAEEFLIELVEITKEDLNTAIAAIPTTKTGYSLSNDGIDAIFTRPSTNYDSLLRSLGGAVSKLVNRLKSNAGSGKLEIYKADDSTKLGEQTITSDPDANPITELNTD